MDQSNSTPLNRISCLPTEILVTILRDLDARELVSCRLTCKAFRAMIDTISELQYALELSVYGLVERGDSKSSLSLDIGRRRELLSQYWASRCRDTYKWQPLPRSISAWFRSIFHADNGSTLYSGNVLMIHERLHDAPSLQHTLHCFALVRQEAETNQSLKVEVLRWSCSLDPFVAFGADPGEDLLVLVRRCFDSSGTSNLDVTIRTLSQLAAPFRETSIQVSASMGNTSRSIRVLIRGSTIALVLNSAATIDAFGDLEVLFINSDSRTVTGRFCHPSAMIPDSRGHNAGIALLDETSFFVLCAHYTHHTLSLYSFAPHNHQADGSPFTTVAVFNLPSFAPGTICAVRELCCTTSFQSTYRPTSIQPHDSDTEPYQPLISFDHSPSHSLVHISLLYSPVPPADSHVRAESMDIRHIINPAVFFEALNTYRSGCQNTRSVPWTEWGPQNSRSIRMRSSVHNEFASHGSRVMVSDGLARTRHILDFNTLPYALHQHRGEALPTGVCFVGRDEPTVIPHGYIFDEDITGTLPYYKISNISPTSPHMLWRHIQGGDIWLAQGTIATFQQEYEILT